MTTLTPSRLAEIEAHLTECRLVDGLRALHAVGQAKGYMLDAADLIDAFRADVPALLADRAALQAEVERLRKVEASCIQLVENATNARVEAIEAHRLRRIAQTEAAHARESAAREMRERCVKEAKTHEETARELLKRAKADGNDRLADNHEGAADAAEEIADALSALPLTPTDGAKDE